MDTTEIPTDRTRMAWEYEGFTLQVWRPVHVDTWLNLLTGFIQVIGDTDPATARFVLVRVELLHKYRDELRPSNT